MRDNDDFDAIARMESFRQSGAADQEDRAPGRANVLLACSCVLSLLALLLFACTLSVVCSPDSSFSQLVVTICRGIC